MLDSKEVLEKIDNNVVIEIMEENGSPLYSRSKDGRTGQECLWFKTICHGGDSHKLCYFTESKDFYCYTSCGRMTFFDFIKRIRGYKEEEFFKCISYVAKKIGVDCRQDRVGLKDSLAVKATNADLLFMEDLYENREKKNEQLVEISKFYDPAILNYFDSRTFYKGWLDEGISEKTLMKYQIKWYELEKHIIIPHFNQKGDLVGIRRRSLKPEDARNKYMPEFIEGRSYEHPLGLNLYGLYQNQAAIKKRKSAILVEGEKSVLLSDTYYGSKSIAVATCGFNISRWQIKALMSLGVEKLYLAFDKDYDILDEAEYMKNETVWRNYQHYLLRLKTLANRVAPNFQTYLILDKKGVLKIKDSPFDRGKTTLEGLIKNRKLISDQGMTDADFL